VLLPDPDGEPFGPFEHALDLFGDGSLRLVSLPGHAAGMLGALVATRDRGHVFMAADGCWSRRLIDSGDVTRGVHRFIAKNRADQLATYHRLIALRKSLPAVAIIPSHCPIAAADFGLG